jgi:hypothetical protein
MVPPQYLHKCSGGLFRVGTIVGIPKKKLENKQKKRRKKGTKLFFACRGLIWKL